MRILDAKYITNEVYNLILKSNTELDNDVCQLLSSKKNTLVSPDERKNLEIILKNMELSRSNKTSLCQDTGMSVFFIETGKINIEGNDIYSIINEAVRKAYTENPFRHSILDDPLDGINTQNNTPPFIHIEYNNTDNLKIKYMSKGGGSENAGAVAMLAPSEGKEGIYNFILNQVRTKGINACPPLIIGIGIGGTMDHAAMLSKKALFRKIKSRNKKTKYAEMEIELLNKINALNIGIFAYGGELTAIEVFIEESPRHIACMPVAVSMLCHSVRRGEITL